MYRDSRRESAVAPSSLRYAGTSQLFSSDRMIIALEKDDGSLFVFASIAEAETEFELIDIENGEYEFCDHAGQRFVAEIAAPARAFQAGSYRLHPKGAPDKELVCQLVARASNLSKGTPDVRSLEDLRKAQSLARPPKGGTPNKDSLKLRPPAVGNDENH